MNASGDTGGGGTGTIAGDYPNYEEDEGMSCNVMRCDIASYIFVGTTV